MKVVRSSLLRTGRLYPQEYPGTHFRGWVDPRAHGTVWCPGKNPQWLGIDPGTLRLVAQCLNHYTYIYIYIYIYTLSKSKPEFNSNLRTPHCLIHTETEITYELVLSSDAIKWLLESIYWLNFTAIDCCNAVLCLSSKQLCRTLSLVSGATSDVVTERERERYLLAPL